MEMKIVPYKAAEAPQFNYAELKAGLREQLAKYETAIYTDDQIRDAKADKAALNKLRKAMNDERIRMEREYMQPFAEFKGKVNELIAMVDKPVRLIDEQVRDFEERRREEKRKRIEESWKGLLQADKVPAGVEFRRIFDEKWLNASVSMKLIGDEMAAKMDKIVEELAVIRALPEYAYEAEQMYLGTLDLAKAMAEAQRLRAMAERKAAHEAEQQRRREEAAAQQQAVEKPAPVAAIQSAPIPEAAELKTWLSFKALLSVDDALALREFFNARGIEFEAV